MSGRRTRPTQPVTRDLTEIVTALKTTEAELGFQIGRLARTSGSTLDENEHLSDLVEGYTSAAKYIAILRRYQEGRIARGQRDEDGNGSEDAFAPNSED